MGVEKLPPEVERGGGWWPARVKPDAREVDMTGIPRLTRRVFKDLAIWMVALGVATGITFPFFVIPLGVSVDTAFTASFFAACCAAGLFVGGLNFILVPFAREPFPVVGAVTVSIGVCDLEHAGDADQLCRRADRALYWAKASGRNVCVLHPADLPDQLQRDQHPAASRL
jgi:hypothetical protein